MLLKGCVVFTWLGLGGTEGTAGAADTAGAGALAGAWEDSSIEFDVEAEYCVHTTDPRIIDVAATVGG